MTVRRRTLLAAAAAGAAALPLVNGGGPAAAGTVATDSPAGLTNLAHLDFLCTTVRPPDQAGHATYRQDAEPDLGVLWTYANRQTDGTYQRVGGGQYDPATNTYGQGAFNADDISRAAVVYVRHWQATASASSRTTAYQLLRGLTYLQTTSASNAGNVVLWMQPDGTLNPSPTPKDAPDPSDSADSYWLARTIWALGEGYAAFVDNDLDFAGFLAQRLRLAVSAVNREVLNRFGQWLDVDGVRTPAWLITQGADATGEALLGLASYVAASGDLQARDTLTKLGDGVASMRSGDSRTWPYGAVLPWVLSQADWHGWAGLAPAGLARAYQVVGGASLRNAALSDAASFTPHLLITAGPQNGWLPAPTDLTQIAYGAHSRVESVLAAAAAAERPTLRLLAGIAASWFFGNNPAGTPMYDPATGVTYDGVDGSGGINHNSGAESTIHGLLAMLALDATPDAAAVAQTANVVSRETWRLVEAESGSLTGDASIYSPTSAWTGESLWSGGSGAQIGPGGMLTLDATVSAPSLLMPVVNLSPGAGTSHWRLDGVTVGVVRHGDVGPQGDSPAPGLLAVRTLPHAVTRGTQVTVTAAGGTVLVDALLIQREVEQLVLSGGGYATALLRSFASEPRNTTVDLPGTGTASVWLLDSTGRTIAAQSRHGSTIQVTVPPGGTVIVRRG
jgi:hypothetical protein